MLAFLVPIEAPMMGRVPAGLVVFFLGQVAGSVSMASVGIVLPQSMESVVQLALYSDIRVACEKITLFVVSNRKGSHLWH